MNWQLKTSSLARAGMAPCALSVPYTALSPDHHCARHKPLEQAAAEARVLYLARIDKKHQKGTA
jgi:hypothetical protein